MLITESHIDVPTTADGNGSMRIFLFHPQIPDYPQARFPGVVVFSEIYQVTGPIQRFSRSISSHGMIVAAPSSYHEFLSPSSLAYDVAGTDRGNLLKTTKTLAAYDEDARLSVDTLLALPTCNGAIGVTGMCLGGHLAFRAAVTEGERVRAAVCYFATDLQGGSLGREGNRGDGIGDGDGTLRRAGEVRGEVVMIFGKKDTHVPPAGRDLIRKTLHEKGVIFSWYEVAHAQHAFIRDELSKGRYDPAVANICFQMLLELFGRTLKSDLGPRESSGGEPEHLC